ncbi:hypothetical protein RFI_33673, partial [Reticulomyxa filosa]
MKKSDIWSVGIIAYILVMGKPPFVGNESQILKQILAYDETKSAIDFSSKKKQKQLSVQCRDFILKLLTRDTTKRFSADDALRHPFLLNSQSTMHLGDELLHDIGKFQDAGMS